MTSRFEYRPGNNLTVSSGVRFITETSWVPQLQVNLTHKDKDSGANADVDNSEGTLVYLSPGVSYNSSTNTQFYGFVQLPLYQNVDGWQLTPRWTATLGMSYAF
jgi:hypothetical protein